MGWDRSKNSFILENKHYFLSSFYDGHRKEQVFRWNLLIKSLGKWQLSEERSPEFQSKEAAISYLESKLGLKI